MNKKNEGLDKEEENLKGIFLGLSYSGFSKCPFS